MQALEEMARELSQGLYYIIEAVSDEIFYDLVTGEVYDAANVTEEEIIQHARLVHEADKRDI